MSLLKGANPRDCCILPAVECRKAASASAGICKDQPLWTIKAGDAAGLQPLSTNGERWEPKMGRGLLGHGPVGGFLQHAAVYSLFIRLQLSAVGLGNLPAPHSTSNCSSTLLVLSTFSEFFFPRRMQSTLLRATSARMARIN